MFTNYVHLPFILLKEVYAVKEKNIMSLGH